MHFVFLCCDLKIFCCFCVFPSTFHTETSGPNLLVRQCNTVGKPFKTVQYVLKEFRVCLILYDWHFDISDIKRFLKSFKYPNCLKCCYLLTFL